MEWFIVAIVIVHGDTYYSKMDRAFQTKEVCQKYYQRNMSVRDDVLLMYPQQSGHTLVCLNKDQIAPLEGKQQV